MPTRGAIVAAARELKGVRWVHQGRHREAGVDCVGLLVLTADACGIVHDAPRVYSRMPEGERLLEEMGRFLVAIPLEAAGAGDVLVFWVRKQDVAQHVGILAPGPRIIHAINDGPSKQRVVTEVGYDARWQRRAMAAFRFPGLVLEEAA